VKTVEKEITKEETKYACHRRDLDDSISDDARKVYMALNFEPMHIDDIVRATGLKMNIVLSSLTELELMGYVEQTSGKNYRLV
jgi:predicted Rossmann fold nucleotide-binding protein DprA/Smf involved in DNA uptake